MADNTEVPVLIGSECCTGWILKPCVSLSTEQIGQKKAGPNGPPSVCSSISVATASELLVTAPAERNNRYSADQRHDAKDGWKRNGVMLFLGRLDGTNIEHFFLGGVRETLIDQGYDPDHHQDYAEYCFSAQWILQVAQKLMQAGPALLEWQRPRSG
jgi:hypothetical protein